MGNVFKKNKMTEAIEPLAVDLGVDGYVNAVAEKGFTDATKDAVSSGIDNAKQDVKGKVEKAEEVAGFIQDDFNSLKENVSDFFASDEEKRKKKEEEEAKKKAEEEQKKAEEEAAEEYRNMLDRSYILHTACIVCSCAYTNESVNPSYIVVPKSHGEFIHGMPQLTVADYIANQNVLDFGICRSPKNPAVQEKAREILDEVQEETKSWTDKVMDLFVDKSKKTVCDSKESLAAYCAAKCTPQFFTGWADGKEDVFIDGQKALLGRCTMSCAYGGEITIQSSGQPE